MNGSDRKDFELEEEYDFYRGIRGRFYKPRKVTTTIRLDDDIVLMFKKIAGEKKVGYQTLVNKALRDYLRSYIVRERENGCYPIYMRDRLKANKAPMKSIKRFVPNKVLPLQ